MSNGLDRWYLVDRLGGLRRFAVAITVLNVLGHTILGFEQSWAQPVASVGAAYLTELILEWVEARISCRPPKFAGRGRQFVDFLLPAHISGLAVAMLLYANERIWPVVLASIIAIASKSILQITLDGRTRHIFNPSNLGISSVLILFPWVGIAPPYQFTENLHGAGDWILPFIIVCSGSLLNARFTRRVPLIASWLTGFAAQALIRSAAQGTPVIAAFLPMTGVAFLLYSFYMITDPATSPSSVRGQVAFGLATATVYGLLLRSHIVFTLFFALTIVCALRGLALLVAAALRAGRFGIKRVTLAEAPVTLDLYARGQAGNASVSSPAAPAPSTGAPGMVVVEPVL